MSSLNEQEKQLLETLWNQADAVAPAAEKQQHPEHNEFHGGDQAVHGFELLDSYINSGLDHQPEAMQFDQQAAAPTFVGQTPSAQQYQGVPKAHQTAATAGASFQNQASSGYSGQQAGFSGIAPAPAVQGRVEMEQSSAAGFQDQGHGFQQIQSNPVTPAPQMNIAGQEGFQNQAAGFQQQFTANSGASGFQQSYPGGMGTQPVTEQHSFNQQTSIQDYQNSVTGFQQQPQQQQQQQQQTHQQALFQQSIQTATNSSSDQTYQNSAAEGTALCFSGDLPTYPQQTGQQPFQGTTPSNAGVASPGSAQPGSIPHQQHQYQNSSLSTTQTEQGSGGAYQGQVNQYPKSQSFSSPTGSPGQAPVSSVPSSPASYPQPSQELGTQHTQHAQHTFPPVAQAPVQADQSGANFAGQVAGFSSGQVSGFQKQSSFQSPAPSPHQETQPGESTIPSSPANNFQQLSPGFAVQPSYPSSSQPLVQGDQNTGGSFPSQTPDFPQSVPAHGDQSTVAGFQGNAVFSPKNAVAEDPSMTSNFPTQASPYQRRSSAQGEGSAVPPTGSYQQPAYPCPTQAAAPVPDVAPQPMQEESAVHNMDAEAAEFAKAAEFLQKTFQSVDHMIEDTGSVARVPFQPVSAPQTLAQRDQPMDTQPAPYLPGAGSCTGNFQVQTPQLAQQALFTKPPAAAAQGPQSAGSGTTFIDQPLSFQGQANSYQTGSSSSQSLPSSVSVIPAGEAQNHLSFSGSELVDNKFSSSQNAAPFSSENLFPSGQYTSASLSLTNPVSSSMSPAQVTASVAGTVAFNAAVGNPSSFNQFSGSMAPPFGHDGNLPQTQQQQQQQQQFPQPPVQHQQQVVQQTAFSSQAQDGNLTLVRNTSSHTLSSMMTEVSQPVPFQPVTTAPPAVISSQTLPASGWNGNQYSSGQTFPAHQTVVNSEQPAQLMQSLPGQGVNISVSVPQTNSIPTQQPPSFAQGTTNLVSNLPNNVNQLKSPAASVQDSNQANTALSLLSTVLQQIQAILPVTTGQQAEATNPGAPAASLGSDPEALSKLLQSQKNAQQVLQLLQHQKGQPQLQQANSAPAVEQSQEQTYPFRPQQQQQQQPQQPPQQQQQQQPMQIQQLQPPSQLQQGREQESTPALQQPQQPNFLIQQSKQQQLLFAQPPPQSQGQQMVTQIPSSLVTSLAGSLGNLGVTLNSEGQLIIGQQPVKVELVTNAAPASLSMPASLGPCSFSPAVTTVSLSGQAAVSQRVSESPQVGVLPMDLQNVNLNLFGSTAASASVTSMTHTINTTPTTVPNIGSISAGTTSVNPTSALPQPLSVAGVGLGLGMPTTAGDASVSNTAASGVGLGNAEQAVAAGGKPGDVKLVSNIFYPEVSVSSSDSGEKVAETEEGFVPAAAPLHNFLNVTTGSASMLLNAFSMVVADAKSEGSGLKVCDFAVPAVSSEEKTPKEVQQSGKSDATDMDVSESFGQSSGEFRPMDTDKPIRNLTPRHSRKASMEEEFEQRGDFSNSMLRRILTMKDDDGNTPGSKAPSPTPDSSPVETPTDVFVDGNTQATLIEKSEKLGLDSDIPHDDDMQPEFWTTVPSFANATVEEVVPSKVHRGHDDVDASSKQVSLPSVEKLFDAGGATSSSAFVFTKFGAEVPGVRTFGNSTSETGITISPATSVPESKMSGVVSAVKPAEVLKIGPVPTASVRPSARRQKDPGLTFQFPNKVGNCELRILAQPEEQHRARYLTEGSRGAVKDRSQQGYPVVKLIGYNEPAILQIFIGSESGRVKPHGFYQACKICGKNSTQCNERDLEGTNVIEIEISPMNDMQVNMDCVSILKLRNADVEKRIGPTKAKAKKKNSTKARLVFRCTLRKPDGSFFTLQAASTPILCTQPIGQPEISRMSLSELCVNQTSDLFIIGKNFLKGTQIVFREIGIDETDVKWQTEADIEMEYFQQNHVICRVPEYPDKDLKTPVRCQIVVLSGGKTSGPQEFTYKPAMVMIKEENAMETEPSAANKTLPFGVSPVALQLNRLVERTQHLTPSSGLFQLPPGAVPSISPAPVLAAPPKLVSSSPAQPLSSILKPPTLSLSSGASTLTLGPVGGGSELRGAFPVQFVLPPHALGSAVSLDSRDGGRGPGPVPLMPKPGVPLSAGGKAAPQSVFTLASMPNAINTSPTVAVNGQASAAPPAGPASSAPMIVVLAGPQSSAGTSAPGAITPAVDTSNGGVGVSGGGSRGAGTGVAVPVSFQQPVNSGQVESLLKLILESSQPSSS